MPVVRDLESERTGRVMPVVRDLESERTGRLVPVVRVIAKGAHCP